MNSAANGQSKALSVELLPARPETHVAVEYLRDKIQRGEPGFALEDTGRGFTGMLLPTMVGLRDLQGWIAERNGRVNLYESVNPVRGEYIRSSEGQRGKKAALRDIARVTRLHIDLDPRKGESLLEERARILALLTDEARLKNAGLPGGPTSIVDSGGGYWAFWELIAPLALPSEAEARTRNPDDPERAIVAAAIEAGRRNKWLSERLNDALGGRFADDCHNIDRVARLPGTINLPNERKRAAGRTAAGTGIIARWPERVYGLEQFPEAEIDHSRLPTTSAERAGVFIGAPKRLPPGEDVEPILRAWAEPYRVSEETLRKILVGDGYNDADRDKTRSGVLYNVMRALLHLDVPPEEIYGLLIDARLGCSAEAHDLEKNKGRGAEWFVHGQLTKNVPKFNRERAVLAEGVGEERPLSDSERGAGSERIEGGKTAEINADGGAGSDSCAPPKEPKSQEEWLAWMNANHAVLTREGGRALVLSWSESEIPGNDREFPVLQNFSDFRNAYCNAYVTVKAADGKETKKPVGDWWLKHPKRRQFYEMRFLPKQNSEIRGYLNLWRGWSVEPCAGDWSLMEQHIRETLANGDEEVAEYILNWSAWSVQRPDEPAEVALVFRGGKGCGKGVFGRTMRSLFGQHGMQVHSSSHLTGRFNFHLRDCCLLFADEAFLCGDKKTEGLLKGLITEPEITIEAKGRDAKMARNLLHIIMASNEEWVVPASHDERRYAVFEVSGAHVEDRPYFKALYAELANGGRAAMLHALLSRELGDWHPRNGAPETEAMRQQKELSLSPLDQALLTILETGVIPGARHGDVILSNRVEDGRSTYDGLYDCIRRENPKLRDISDRKISAAFKELGGIPARVRWGGSTNSRRGLILPAMTDLRAAWDKKHGKRSWEALPAVVPGTGGSHDSGRALWDANYETDQSGIEKKTELIVSDD